MVTLTMSRYGQSNISVYTTVAEAARSAASAIEENNAAPHSIVENGVLVWKNGGPFDGGYDKLRELAGLADEDAE